MDYSYNYNYDYSLDPQSTGLLAGFGIGYLIFCLAIAALMIVAMWKIFAKAGKPGWHSLIPLLNLYDLMEISGYNGWLFLLMCVPIANVVMMILMYIGLAKKFGKSGGFAVGLIFLNTIFTLILAFGSAKYEG